MIGEGAYTRYTEMFNDAAPISVPNFSNVAAAVKWTTDTRKGLGEILDEEEDDEHAD
jgi:hypothetical protein